MPGNASAALISNWPNSNAKALSLDLIHSFRPALVVGIGELIYTYMVTRK